MIWHLLLTPLITFLNALYAALPPWNVDLGQSWLIPALGWLSTLDKFAPLHDGLLPVLTLVFAIFVALNAVKWFKFILSLIPTISASG